MGSMIRRSLAPICRMLERRRQDKWESDVIAAIIKEDTFQARYYKWLEKQSGDKDTSFVSFMCGCIRQRRKDQESIRGKR